MVFYSEETLAETSLGWKFTRGETFYLHHEISQTVVTNRSRNGTKDKADFSRVLRIDVRDIQKGKTNLSVTIESISYLGSHVQIEDKALRQAFLGATFELSLDNKGVVSDLRGYDDWMDRISEGNREKQQELQQRYSRQKILSGFSSCFSMFPNSIVRDGEYWNRSFYGGIQESDGQLQIKESLKVLPQPTIGSSEASNELVEFTSEATADYKLPKIPDRFGWQITEGTLSLTKFEGQGTIDLNAGRIRDYTYRISCRGTLVANREKATTRYWHYTHHVERLRFSSSNPLEGVD